MFTRKTREDVVEMWNRLQKIIAVEEISRNPAFIAVKLRSQLTRKEKELLGMNRLRMTAQEMVAVISQTLAEEKRLQQLKASRTWSAGLKPKKKIPRKEEPKRTTISKKSKDTSSKKVDVTCFNCSKKGHRSSECRLLKDAESDQGESREMA